MIFQKIIVKIIIIHPRSLKTPDNIVWQFTPRHLESRSTFAKQDSTSGEPDVPLVPEVPEIKNPRLIRGFFNITMFFTFGTYWVFGVPHFSPTTSTNIHVIIFK
jgi:hypothetical protein